MKQRVETLRGFVLLIALLACPGCGDGDGESESFGMSRRITVTNLTFPTGVPQPSSLTPVVAFPNLAFDRPLFLTFAPDASDRLFVVEQAGRIHVLPNDPSVTATQVFLDIRGRVNAGGEEGLLGLAFHPDYSANGFFYVYYSVASPRRIRLSRFQVSADPDLADASSETIFLELDQPFSNHNGGMLAFGPDRMLYIASGDGGSGGDPQNNAQNLTNLLGKILRIDPAGTVPPDNPFVGQGGGVRPEIWAYGLRNPWRFSFDRNTGDLWLGDVGQNEFEEVDIIVKGGNYGWRLFEGDQEFNNPTNEPPSSFNAPVLAYPHSEGRSVTGGYVYRGTALPSILGAYIYGDFTSDRIWALVYDGNQVISNTEVASVQSPSSFGEDAQGELYVCSFGGRIYRFEESGGGQGEGTFPEWLSDTGLFTDTANLVASPGVIEYDVNSPLWSDGALKRRWIAVPGIATIGFQAVGSWDFPSGTVIVKHFQLDVAPGVTQRLETRVLINHDTGWQGYTYRWNIAQTDAQLLVGAETATFVVEDPAAPGGQRDQTWYFPSRTDCLSCHTTAAGRVLGVRTYQLNRDFPYSATVDNQLRAWNHIRLFDLDIGDHTAYGRLPEPLDMMEVTRERARSYLHVNCAQCHLPGGPTPVDLDFRFETPTAQMNAVNSPSTTGLSNVPGSVRIDPGAKETSVVWELMRRLDAARMPPFGSSLVDEEAVDLIGAWIDDGAE